MRVEKLLIEMTVKVLMKTLKNTQLKLGHFKKYIVKNLPLAFEN